MPIIKKSDILNDDSSGNIIRSLSRGEVGATNLTVSEITVPPGNAINVHIHPGHEECMIIIEGTFKSLMGDTTEMVESGDIIIAPDGVPHGLENISNENAVFIAIFPTIDVQREWI